MNVVFVSPINRFFINPETNTLLFFSPDTDTNNKNNIKPGAIENAISYFQNRTIVFSCSIETSLTSYSLTLLIKLSDDRNLTYQAKFEPDGNIVPTDGLKIEPLDAKNKYNIYVTFSCGTNATASFVLRLETVGNTRTIYGTCSISQTASQIQQ